MKTLWHLLLLSLALTQAHCSRSSDIQSSRSLSDEEKEPERHSPGQRVVPEIPGIPVRSVVLSQMLFTRFQNYDLLNTLFKAGVPEVIIVVPAIAPQMRADEQNLYFRMKAGQPEIVTPYRKQAHQKLTILPHEFHSRDQVEPSAWARDWGPITARDIETAETRFLDFRYLSGRPVDELAPELLARNIDQDRIIPTVRSDIKFEGGNFVIDELGYCAVSESMIAQNRRDSSKASFEEDRQISTRLQTITGCKDIDIFPRLPFELTGHVDIWMKFVGKKTVMLAYLPQVLQSLPMYNNPSQQAAFRKVKEFLQDKQEFFQGKGWKVIPVPMSAPVFELHPRSGQVASGAYRSYLNSLAVNRDIIIPRYISPKPDSSRFEPESGPWHDGIYVDNAYLDDYEELVKIAYQQAGFETLHWVNADLLVNDGGAIHCSTMQIPEWNL